jgi:general nucleoside transport system ATP-binding protein
MLRAPMAAPVIKLDAVTKRFGDFTAVREASAEIGPGEIHAVVGENGAGKSTLMKLAAGVLAPTSGRVLVDDRPLAPATPAEAIRRGIGMVHQHFMLAGAFRALENVILGSEPVAGLGRLNFAEARRRAEAIAESSGLRVPLDAVTDALTVGERQRLEILRVLYRGARAILLDEPTAVLSPIEADELYRTLRSLAEGGATIAVVTHRLDEVSRFADRVTVMRRGAVVLSRPYARGKEASHDEGYRKPGAPPEASGEELTRAIMGGEPPPPFARPAMESDAKAVLEIQGLSLIDASGHRRLEGIDLTVHAGEIVGVAGVEGNGQRELVRALAGMEPRARGRVAVGGRDLSGLSVRARRSSLGVVHEDRHEDGLMLDAAVGDNLVLGDLGDDAPGFDEAATIDRRIDRFGVRPPDRARLAGELSGGNQQKIVIARTLDRLPRGPSAACVLAQPTRGVDVGAAASIHAAIGEAAAAGLATLVVSADLAELRRLSHRIVVMRRGAIVTTLSPEATETEIGRAMLGEETA